MHATSGYACIWSGTPRIDADGMGSFSREARTHSCAVSMHACVYGLPRRRVAISSPPPLPACLPPPRCHVELSRRERRPSTVEEGRAWLVSLLTTSSQNRYRGISPYLHCIMANMSGRLVKLTALAALVLGLLLACAPAATLAQPKEDVRGCGYRGVGACGWPHMLMLACLLLFARVQLGTGEAVCPGATWPWPPSLWPGTGHVDATGCPT